MSSAPDVVVIGAGAVGAACAYELTARGATVEVLERGDDWGVGCSAGNTGLIVPSHSRPLANPAALRDGLRSMTRRDTPFGLQLGPAIVPWAARYALSASRGADAAKRAELLRTLAFESFDRWAALVPEHFQNVGYLNVYTSADGFAAARAAAAPAGDGAVRTEVLEAEAALEFEPALQAPIAGAVLYPDAAHGDPSRLVSALGAAAVQQGAQLRCGVTVTGLRPDGGLDTSAGVVRAGTIVLASGVTSGHLGVRLPLAAGHGSSIDVVDGLAHPRLPVVLEEEHVLASPFGDRTRLAGTFEIGTTDTKRVVAERRVTAMVAGGRRLLRAEGTWSARPLWSGSGPIAPDGMPIIGRLPRRPQVVAATAHSLLGITLAPATGRLVADIVGGGAPPRALAPERFAFSRG